MLETSPLQQRDPQTVTQYTQLLISLKNDTHGVLSVTLASADGLTVASTLSDAHEAARLAAMSGSISALASALARETDHGAPERLILESSQGLILTMNVPAASGDMVLTVVTSRDALLGKLLWSCSSAVQSLGAVTQPAAATA
jgi:predicted regulator of Ras-like GTPase activity (Roadblock/LC7/MglB family)